ncbi:MAG: type secretion system effector, Hcp1 family [Chthonomonadales bacterium]|nr:type secretion system effector, Hcp1 family [Chthonomonadales bacterium]
MKIGNLGLLAPIALLCFVPGTLARTSPKAPTAALRQRPLTSTEFTITIRGSRQGVFKGDGRRNEIRGLSYDLEIVSPRDPASGLPTGRVRFNPITITKEWGAASPQILAALVTNELLPAVQLTFTSTNIEGRSVVDHVITLTDANVVDVHHHPVAGLKDSTTDKFQLEDISFNYRKIEVTDKTANTTFVGDTSGNQP